MANVFVIGIGMTELGKIVQRSVKDMTERAVSLALRDANLEHSAVQAAWFSNTRQGLLEGQNGIRGQCALRPLGFQGIAITNVENACASGSTALLQATAHIEAGYCDVALVVGAEKMFFPQRREAMFQAFNGGTDIYRLEEFRRQCRRQCQELIPPQQQREAETTNHSFFMESYAAQARLHMQRFGTTQRQLAMAAAKNHQHSRFNPLAQYRHSLSVEQVLAQRSIVWPLTLPMCAPISDGAAAAVLCSASMLRRLGGHNRAVRIRGIHLASGSDRPAEDFEHHIGRLAALQAYAQAQIDPRDIDVAEVHDATAYAEIQQLENLGLCPPGEGGPFTERGHTALGGSIPVNPSGGLVSKGHPVGATGIIQLHELVHQLRAEAGPRQVANPRIAVAENGGGFYETEEAATVVTVLERASA
ncbi:thiolase family protein [Microbulbifer spongiae]|uniref:propanoyl-CoA C-acyltransferase n=1 Tax=Microbulbifer spongiae TaxID=2944933 RepID=A0ABY9EEW7_9GAMM|nr:thiolase family protein [Microbulbifer sp. MI-G]WKD51519.1 thiolase family protein [Microbulbifer sp. MI-G]